MRRHSMRAHRPLATALILPFLLAMLLFVLFDRGTGASFARSPSAPRANNAYTLTLPSVLKFAQPPIAQINYADGIGYQPLQGSILTTTTVTLQVELLPDVTDVVVLQSLGGSTAVTITANFPDLENNGVATATIDLVPGDYRFTVQGQRAGIAGQTDVGAVLLAPEIVVYTSPQTFPFAEGVNLDDDPIEFEDNVILLSFVMDATPTEIAAYLREHDLEPLDWIADLNFVRAYIASDSFAPALVEHLNENGGDLLDAASLNVLGNRRAAVGERMPVSLTAGYQAMGNADCSAAGNVWRGCFEHSAGSTTSLVSIFRFHFIMDTFAGHRLVQHLLPNNPTRPGLAISDSGIGYTAPAANTQAGIPVADLFGFASGPFNCDANGNDTLPGGAAKTIANVVDTDGHGTNVASAAAGRLGSVLGVGRDVRVRPLRDNATTAQIIAAIACAARDTNVHVMNISWGTTGASLAQRRQMLNAVRLFTRSFRDGDGDGVRDVGEPFFDTNGNGVYDTEDMRIFVVAMDNRGVNRGTTSIPDAFAPDTLNNTRTITDPLVMGVCATGSDTAPPRGPEHIPSYAAWGQRKSVSAPGDNVVLPDQNGVLAPRQGCSFSAPMVAGLATEMRMLDRNLNATPANRFTPLQIIEAIEATADDLGTTITANNAFRANDQPGNGNDAYFGQGRINVWKAILAVVNRGVAAESHTNVGATFPSLSSINEANTKWYGFKIHTPLDGSTVWIDGVQVTDASTTAPGGTINAYAGVRMDRTIRVGIISEDPTSGIVPLGSQSDFLLTFSIERSDLVKGGGNRVLQLRRPGQGADDAPYFNLELKLQPMRDGEIPGVVFDDFVFEITPPDFGDAAATPTTLAEDGAHHRHVQMEYFGSIIALTSVDAVSGEHNVLDFSDVDGISNWGIDLHDLDGKDDGMVFYPLSYKPGATGRVDVTVCVPAAGARYDPADQDKQIFVNGWFDWNTNGRWDSPAEHMLDGLRLAPNVGTAAGWAPRSTTADHKATVTLIYSNERCGKYKVTFTVPAIGDKKLESRWRLDYGENVGRHTNTTFTSTTTLTLTAGAAYYGEVEDYVIGSDFGDAGPDAPWPTKLASNGPRHLSYHREWIGPFGSGTPAASREPDGCMTSSGDQDGEDNIGSDCTDANQDSFDDFNVTIIAPGKIKVEFEASATVEGYGFQGGNGGVTTLKANCTVGAIGATPATPAHQRVNMRYDANNPEERLYVNLFADWDGNGSFETTLLSAPMDPEDWGTDGAYTLGEPFVDANKDGVWNSGESFTDVAGMTTRKVTCEFDAPVPPPADVTQWVRLRLDYGENVGQFIRGSDAFQEEPPHVPAKALGGAVWGEVEDKPLIGPSKRSNVPAITPDLTFHYTLMMPANPGLTEPADAAVSDQVPLPLTFVGESSLTCSLPGACTYDGATRTVSWGGLIDPQQTLVIEFAVKAPEDLCETPTNPNLQNKMDYFDGIRSGSVMISTPIECPVDIGDP